MDPPVSAVSWNTLSASEEDGNTIAQISLLMRASDPIYEIGFRLAGSRGQDDIWFHMLSSLAVYFGVKAPVQMQKTCIDPGFQWLEARNIWYNAMIRTVLYCMVHPAMWMHWRFR